MKFVVHMPYGEYVFDHEDAMRLAEILERAEKYETKWRNAEEGGSTHHIYREPEKGLTLKHLTPEVYEVAKMAGRPPKD